MANEYKSAEWRAPSLRSVKVPEEILLNLQTRGNQLDEETFRALSKVLKRSAGVPLA